LRTIRKLADFWLFKALMLILIVSFVMWGVGDIFRGNPQQRAVAKVDGTSITVHELQNGFKESLARARQTLDPSLTEQKAKQLGLVEIALDALIGRTEVSLEAKRLGVELTPEATVNWLATRHELRNKDGSLNKDMFRRLAERSHMN